METELLNKLGQIAGIAGIALGVFFLLFRDVIRKKIFPQLSQRQSYQIILVFMILSWSVAIAGIIAWLWSGKNGSQNFTTKVPVLTVSLWRVDFDTKGSLLASRELRGVQSGVVSTQNLKEIIEFVAAVAGLPKEGQSAKVQLKIHVPADLKNRTPRIERIPPGPLQVLLWDTRGRGKLRSQLTMNALKDFDEEFQLEIRIPGYGTQVISVTPGIPIDSEENLDPAPVRIGVEEFTGAGEGIADRLAAELSVRGGVKVSSPRVLEAIRDQVREHNQMIAENPHVQMALRELGLDMILSGSLREEPIVSPK